jgi:hypothetical protein
MTWWEGRETRSRLNPSRFKAQKIYLPVTDCAPRFKFSLNNKSKTFQEYEQTLSEPFFTAWAGLSFGKDRGSSETPHAATVPDTGANS